MVAIVTTDLHRNANPRDAYRHDWWWKFLLPTLRDLKADTLIILGDITDQKDYHGSVLTNRIAADIAAAAEFCDVYILQGNHDYTSAANPFFGFLDRYPNVRWIKSPVELDQRGLGSCLFIPHLRNPDDWRDLRLLDEEYDWVFTHATFTGAKGDNGESLDGVSINLVQNHRVVSGDVHVPQRYGNVTYVGAPYRCNFGDRYDARILVLRGHKMTSLPSKGPRKVLLEVDKLTGLDRGEQIAGDIIKVRYSIAAVDYDKWPEIHQAIVGWAAQHDLKLDSVTPVPQVQLKERPRITRADLRNDRDVMGTYCNRYKVGKSTLEVGLQIMERA